MDPLTSVVVAVALAMDCLSVSVAYSMGGYMLTSKDILKMGSSFGTFQMLAPLLGWSIAISMAELIDAFDHWVAFGLLCLVGARLIYESRKDYGVKVKNLSIYALLSLSIATSIDTFAVGIGIGILRMHILLPSLVFGAVSFLFTLLGAYLGRMVSKFIGKNSGILGGAILIGIGLKILLEHTLL